MTSALLIFSTDFGTIKSPFGLAFIPTGILITLVFSTIEHHSR